MTFERDAKTLDMPWSFTGRENELELVRGALGAGRQGIVVTGPSGIGKTRLVTEALRGTDCARVAGTPRTRQLPFAAFAHLVPETATLHRAVHLLSGVRLLLVDDAHLLDDASAALIHQLAVHARTRLLVVATDDVPVPGAVSRLWTGELLPRLALEPLPREETAQLLTTASGTRLEPLTVNRLHHLCRGDLRLLRDLVGAARERGLLTRVADTDEWAWRGPVPVTGAVRERTAHLLHPTDPDERATLEHLAFAEPLPLAVDDLDLRVLERLEADALVHLDDRGAVRLAHPLHGPVLRAAAGRLRARRLSRTPDRCGPALDAEQAALARRIERADVRDMPTPVGEWLVSQDAPLPPSYAALRARFARLRGELREAAAWAREGLRSDGADTSCRLELTLAAAQSGDTPTAPETPGGRPHGGGAATRPTAEPHGEADRLPAETRGKDRPAAESFGVADRLPAVPHGEADRLPAEPHGEADRLPAEAPGKDRPGAGAFGVADRPVAEPHGVADRLPAEPHGEADRLPAETRGKDRPAAESFGVADRLPAEPHGEADRLPAEPAGKDRPAVESYGDADRPAEMLDGDPYDAVRRGDPEAALGRLTGVFAAHAEALARGDGPGLDRVAEQLRERGFLLYAAEAHAQAARMHRDPSAARTSRTRAVALARRCQGARTPALSGLVLGELTARQRQIVTLAAAGLSNRQIAEKLTLSVRTVGNHLYGAYTRLGTGDRAALPWLTELPDTQPA